MHNSTKDVLSSVLSVKNKMSRTILLVFCCCVFSLSAEGTIDGKRPFLYTYEKSECGALVENPTVSIERMQDKSTKLSFPVALFGGRVLVNSTLNRTIDTLTFRLETAREKARATACVCSQLVKLRIEHDIKDFKTIYIVVDDTVIYESEIPNQK
jgi:hypothetical protein